MIPKEADVAERLSHARSQVDICQAFEVLQRMLI